jgi:hypothetical protein
VRATTVTKTRIVAGGILATLLLTPLPSLGAADAYGLFLNRVARIAPIDASKIDKTCKNNRLCAARLIVKTLGPPARLEAVVHPDTDSIRRVTSLKSISEFQSIGPSTYVMKLDRFGRKLNDEIESNFKSAATLSHLILDLRNNRGGDFDRMRRTAAMFIGPVDHALELDGKHVAIPTPPRRLSVARLTVLIGPRTASSAEILAALLRQHANADILGVQSFGKDYLYRIIPVTQDWRLLLPAERIVVTGETLAGGVVPDGPIPANLARLLD